MKKEMSQARQRDKGQAISEYGLIGALVAVLVIPALVILGGNLNSLFGGMFGSGKPATTVALSSSPTSPTAQPTTTASSTTPPATSTTSQPGIPTAGVSVTMADGTTLALPSYPTNLSATVSTSGANGTTTILANNLQSMATQMLDAGKITQEQYNSLISLANQGHRMALIEKTIEDFATTDPSGQGMLEMASIPFEGKNYHKDDLSAKVGAGGSESALFQQLYQDVANQGLLNDPAVKALISQLTNNITAIGNAFAGATYMADSSREITKDTASQLTNQDSASICTTGNATDSGVHCSG